MRPLAESAADEYQESHAARWELFTPTDWASDPPRQVKQAQYGNITRQINDGLDTQEELVKRNARVLDEAQDAIDQALEVSSGDATARTHAEAHRLRAVVLYYQGMREALAASIQRAAAKPHRARLADIAARASEYSAIGDRVLDSDIGARITELTASIDKTEASLNETRSRLSEEDARIEGLKGRLQAAEQLADSALRARAELEARGLDFSNPQGAAEYEQKLLELDQAYREAERARHGLETGSYRDARLHIPDDFLQGRYVSATTGGDPDVEHGLQHHQRQQALYQSAIAAMESGLSDLRADVERLEGMKSGFLADQQFAGERIAELRTKATEAFEEFNRVDSEAFALEEKALQLFDQSAKAAKAAAGFARNWVTEARDMAQGLSPEAAERSPAQLRQGDTWMGAHIAAQGADALLQRARIFQKRMAAAEHASKIFAAAQQNLKLNEADEAAEREKFEEAREAGVAAVAEAMTVLEAAHRESGRHWTFVAQQATANHLLALFGDDAYRQDALSAYRSAIKGRENEPPAQVFATAANRLEQP